MGTRTLTTIRPIMVHLTMVHLTIAPIASPMAPIMTALLIEVVVVESLSLREGSRVLGPRYRRSCPRGDQHPYQMEATPNNSPICIPWPRGNPTKVLNCVLCVSRDLRN